MPRNGESDWKIEMHEISSKLKHCKKPKGLVKGDIIPELVRKCHDLLAIPLHHIYNTVIRECEWPDLWKSETVKIIPKGKIPQTVKDVRNISCTPLFSKVLEHFVLVKLRTYLSLLNAQFGGIKGVGIDHFLAETWHEVLMSLEDQNSAASLLSIDFSKAFNRMDHEACLKALREANVEEKVVNVVHAFLYNRKMAVHVHGTVSETCHAPGGSPQGSVLGSYLFCATTDRLSRVEHEDNSTINFEDNGHDTTVDAHESSFDSVPSPIAPPMNHFVPIWDDISASDSDDDGCINFGVRGSNRRLLDSTVDSVRASQTVLDQFHDDQEWARPKPTVKAYIDDYNVIEQVRASTALCHISSGKTTYKVHAPGSEKVFSVTKKKSGDIGMIVNDKKTQMLCIHPKGDQMKTYIRAGEDLIESEATLKILGFTFGSTPDLTKNTESLTSSFNRKLWGLQYLKGAGMKQQDLLATYKSVVRPTAEFDACSFHSMLSQEQSTAIERLQGRAMKIVFGDHVSYRTVVESGHIELLHDRREALVKNFALKAAKNERFESWFPENQEIGHDLRRRERYYIPRLRTERAKKSPIIHMRRLLNEIENSAL